MKAISNFDAKVKELFKQAYVEATSPRTVRLLKPHLAKGKSRWVCADFSLHCLNMGTDEGRECNCSSHGDTCYCPYRVARKPLTQEKEKGR